MPIKKQARAGTPYSGTWRRNSASALMILINWALATVYAESRFNPKAVRAPRARRGSCRLLPRRGGDGPASCAREGVIPRPGPYEPDVLTRART